jgi:tetratricopeptide (TPR) repeat protein
VAAAPAAAEPARKPPRAVLSLTGEPLTAPPLDPAIEAKRRRELAAAQEAFARDPEDVDAIVWLGRRTAYLSDYHGAVDIYTEGLTHHPDEPRLLRHRGHRYLTLRRFDEAVVDLQAAAGAMLLSPDEVEDDGLPNAAGVPTSTLYTSVWYHLALAHFLLRDYPRAALAWEACRDAARSDDMRVAAQYWLAIVALRTGERDEAQSLATRVDPDVTLYENFAYRRLLALFAGDAAPEDVAALAEPARGAQAVSPVERATYAFGLGIWHLGHGRATEAHRWFETAIGTGQWASFGALAAEVELADAPKR